MLQHTLSFDIDLHKRLLEVFFDAKEYARKNP